MPPSKKKKTQMRAPPRPIATTSVPKKIEPIQETKVKPEIAVEASDDARQYNNADGEVVEQQALENSTTPEKVEEGILQSLVDKFQDKIEKDISRTIKVLLLVVHTVPAIADTFADDRV
jgi:hypothetical protein